MRHQIHHSASLVAVALSVAALGAQTRITPPDNKYTPQQDVQLGREAADEAERQLPLLRDDGVTSHVERLGQLLVGVIPADLQHQEFRYTFKVVNVREINAFALPGGPMYLNRGMIEAAGSEGEMISVMAHELSHVILRHGTAQASRATKYQVGQLAGAVLGAIIGGNVGTVVSQGTQFGIGTAFLRFSREYEKQADLLGAQLMAKVGYDPRDMANMFRTIEKEGGSNGPQWLSDHPNPSNRQEYITKEAQTLRVDNPIRDTEAFERVQARLRGMAPAPTTEEATRNAERRTGGAGGPSGGAPTGRVAPPSTRYTRYNEGNLFEVSVPSNWRELQDSNAVTFAPNGAYGSYNGQSVFTHGIQIGLARNRSRDLQTATDELIDAFARGNPNLGEAASYERFAINGRRALRTTISNVNEATREPEMVDLVTTETASGDLLYAIGVAPQQLFGTYRPVFGRIVGSIRLRD